MPPEYAMFEQNSISMFLGDRNELTEGERKIIREVGHKFRGKNQWIYFESYKRKRIYAIYKFILNFTFISNHSIS